MFIYLAWKIVCNVGGYLYPAYASFKAIKTDDNQNITPWLMYWIVLALFSVGEGIADNFVFWLPFYYELKLLFILWLVLPQTQGAIVVYRMLVEPFLTTHEDEIDVALDVLQEKTKGTTFDWSRFDLQSSFVEFFKGNAVADRLATTVASALSTPESEQTKSEDGSPASYAKYLPGSVISLFYPPTNPSAQSPAGQDVIYDAIPVDLQSASVNDQKAFLQQQRKQLERKMRRIDQVQKEITERETLPAPSRSSLEQNTAPRRRQKKSNGNSGARRSVVVHPEQDELDNEFERVERDNTIDDMVDMEELRRQQTRNVGIMNYIKGYFAESSGM